MLADSRASERPPLGRASQSVPALTLPSKQCTTSIPRNPSVPGDVHGRIRATMTWDPRAFRASEVESCDKKLGCRRCVSTVRGYMYAVMCLLTRVVCVPLSRPSTKRASRTAQETGSQSQHATTGPVAKHKGSAAVISAAHSYFVDLPMS